VDLATRQEPGDGWSKVAALIAIVKQAEGETLSPERRERILNQVMARAAHERERRRVVHAFAVVASAVLVAGALIYLGSSAETAS
jgi:hypothetical protein